ncbi:MAG: CobD/CbiB family cobalamin biosynthesis protein, partial [Pseudomonadota bacterium]
YSDGVLAPIFWYLVGGLPGLVLYKAVNTADSMWGYRSQSWLYFGRIAARLDDVMNIIPARLTAVLLMITGDIRAFTHHLRATWHHAPRHASVNAGWPEAALASLHDLRLGGPRDYPGQGHTDCWIGAGRGELDAGDIRKACQLFCMMHRCLLAAFALTVAIMSAYMTFYSVYYP